MSTVELEITGKETSLEVAVRQATTQLKGLDQQADKTSAKTGPPPSAAKGWQDLGIAVGGAFAAMKAADEIGEVIGAASDLQQSMGGVDAVFKQSAGEIHAWAQNANTALGLSENAANEFATVLGSQLKNAGTPLDQVAGKVENLVSLGADLAATYGGTTADAVESLSAALKGEMDPIEKYGISLNAAMLQQKAATMGIDGAVASWDTATKQQVILAAITDQSTDALGQFAKQSDSTAEKQQIANAKWTDAKAKLGDALLPTVNKVTDSLAKMADFVARNHDWIVPLAEVVGGLAGIILTVVEAVKIWTTVQWALNIAMDANPVGLIIIAVAALIAIIVLIATKTTWFQDIWHATWDGIKTAAKAVADWFSGPFVGFFVDAWQWIVDKGTAVWDWIKSVPGLLKDAFVNLFDIITSPFRAAFNFVSDAWNNTIGSLSWTVPTWVPFIGGDTISAPHLPKFHGGGIVPGPTGTEVPIMALAGERIDAIGSSSSAPSAPQFVLRPGDSAAGDLIIALLAPAIGSRGGNVQIVLGR